MKRARHNTDDPADLRVGRETAAVTHPPGVRRLQNLQRSAGNAAVCSLLGRSDSPPTSAPPVLDVPVQRMLWTHARRDDAGAQVTETGGVGLINDYSRWLANDTSALVNGEPAGIQGLLKTLKKGEVDGATLRDEVVESIMGSGSWKALSVAEKRLLVAHVRTEEGVDMEPEDDTEGELDAFIEDWDLSTKESFRQWLTDRLGLDNAATVADVVGASPPLAFHADIAYLLYEATKVPYYGDELAAAYVPPFKALIQDVNEGNISAFTYVRKYGASAGSWGAEFTVAAPADMHDKYDSKAVLHTHYPQGAAGPNYAHTKPEEKKTELGFGYTIVDLTQVNGVNETQKTFNAL